MATRIKTVDCKFCAGTGKQPAPEARDQLRAAREKAGVSMRGLAQALEVSYGYLGDVERGARTLTPALAERYITKLEELRNGEK